MRWTDLVRPDLAPEASLGLLAIGLALLDALLWPRRSSRAPSYLTLGGLLVAVSLSLQTWDPVFHRRHGWLYADPAATLADLLILGGAVLAALLAAGEPSRAGDRTAAGVLTALSALGAMVAVSARDLMVLFVGLELSALSLLAYNALGPAAAARAALRQAGPWAAATGLILVGIACLWAGAGTSDWDLARDMRPWSAGLTVTGGALLLAGLAVRAGAVPFHFWVSEVTAGCAPSAVLLTVATAVVPALLVAGRLAEVLAAVRPDLRSLLLAAAILTVTAGNLLALPRRRLARLLSYGVVIQAGYALAALAAVPVGSSPALWLQLAAMILAIAGGLSVSGLIGRGGTAAGLARRKPLAGAALCVCLIALAGLPPTAAFAARAALFSGLAEPPSAGSVLLLANALLSAWVFLRFAARVAWGREQVPEDLSLDAGSLSAAVLSAGVLLLLGLWPAPVVRAAEAAGLAAGLR